MTIIEIIEKKRNSEELSYDELEFAVNGFLDGSVKDYQMSSLLMAIVINGMSRDETFNLTDIMLNSGEIIDLPSGVVDKHSTGGVGDKTTLVLAPLVASCGVPVAKMSGRGLGFTGGTIDKLESISGFNTSISLDSFKKQVSDIGVAIVGQMGNLVPADKKIYALRDVTGTVGSIPLIASSIMSKKLASGADGIVIDVKVGNGALMKSLADAKELASLLIDIGKKYGKSVTCFITNMDEPLGYAIGNSLEVIESINTLKGNGPEDLENLILSLASYMIPMGKSITHDEAYKEAYRNLHNGCAFNKFLEMVKCQGGNIDDLCVSSNVVSVKSLKSGYVKSINAIKLGELARVIGAGRLTKDDKIDFGVGFVLHKKVGDSVLEGDSLIDVYYSDRVVFEDDVLSCFDIVNDCVDKNVLIKEILI